MNSIWKKIITRTTLKHQIPANLNPTYSELELEKGLRDFKRNTKRNLKDFTLISTGILAATFSFKGFLLTNHFIDGGATGISLLISALTDIPLYALIIGINIPFVWLGYTLLGKTFALKTGLAITGLAVCLAVIEIPDITQDNLLIAIFGGFFLGAGIGLAVRGGAVIDGTEVLAIYLSRKFGTTIGDIIIIINVVIFSIAAWLLSVEIALYSMITYLAASKTLDFIIEGIEEYIGVTIISVKNEEIRQMLIKEMGRGVTIYVGKSGFGTSDQTTDTDILYSVITRLELNKLNTELEKIDPNAFIVMHSVKDTKGGMIKKRPLQH